MAIVGSLAGAHGAARSSRLARREALWGIACASPWLAGFIVFTAGPMLASIVLSLTSWNLITPFHFVGFQNYRTLVNADATVWHSLAITTVYAVLAVPLNTAFGLALAILLNQKINLQRFIRTVFYQAFIMTNGGPNDASLFFMLYLYRNAFQYFKMGYASARCSPARWSPIPSPACAGRGGTSAS